MFVPGRLLCMTASLFAACNLLFSQVDRSSLTGTVLDPTGKAIPNVLVRATSLDKTTAPNAAPVPTRPGHMPSQIYLPARGWSSFPAVAFVMLATKMSNS
jgi:hypothetical protein